MSEDTPDRDTAEHPRRRTVLHGHEAAERRLIEAWACGRLHHAFLITGPRGIGKATLAYRFARFLLSHPDPERGAPAADLAVAPDSTAARLIAARSHPDLMIVERQFDPKTSRLRREIAAEDARMSSTFFGLTAGFGGYRVVIVDAADDLNLTAANALLKILEEPPPRAVFLLVSHAPGNLLATIRSRCTRLALQPLNADTVAQVVTEITGDSDDARVAAALARGSPGRALALIEAEAAQLFESFRRLAEAGAPFNHSQELAIAGQLAARGNDGDRAFELFCELFADWLTLRARDLALAGQSGAAAYAAAHEEITGSLRRTNALNLDRRQTMLEAFRAVEQAARISGSARRQ